LIQRDYSKGSFFEYYYKQNTATRNARDQRSTDSGRVVYGGGGISPDEKYEQPALNRLQLTLLGRGAFFYFAAAHFGPKDEAKLPKNWEVDEVTLMDFKKFLGDKNIPYLEGEFQQNIDWVKRQLRVEMITTGVSKEHADEVAMGTDPEVLKAAESLSKARALIEKSKKMVAERKAATSVPQSRKVPF
ncbi:MAG: S41 family peptidase, partial [Bryobacterales bacterium]|nr:S41 family peptidase [Bryobacterales bacterium]